MGGKFKNVEHELDGMKEALDEELAGREDVNRQTAKAEGEAAMWRGKYESEAVAKAEELEMTKMGLQARFTEAETTIENLNGKLTQIERAKGKIGAEIDEMTVNLDQAQILNNAMEKKARQFDKIVGEWKKKVDGLGMDLDVAQKECRNASSDLFRVKSAYEESLAQLEEVRRENKVLSNEIKDIMDQISEGGRSIHEIDKIRKRLGAEKLELQAALEEAEGAPEQEENKVLRAQLELTQVRQEIERRIVEKEEEFLGVKKNMTKAVEGMSAALEQESKGKTEALRMKKKLESDVGELEIALEHSNSNNLETQKVIKKYQQQIREGQTGLEEARTLLEQADKNRRATEVELSDVNEQLSDATVQNQSIAAAKRKLESEMQTLHADLDEMSSEARLCEDKASKAMVDAARLADELRCEQEQAQNLEKGRHFGDAQVKDMQSKLDESETNALKGGKKAMNKLDSRVRELESELESENRRSADSQKNLRKSERRIKELSFAADEDRKNHERMQSLVDQLQAKIKSYKKQIEEAEEIAALNLAKFRKVQGNLSEADQLADLNEQALGKAKARGRSASIGPR